MLNVARLVSFWRCIPMQYNCQKSSNFQGLSNFSRIFGKNDKIPGFFQAGKTVTISPGFPGAVGTLHSVSDFGLLCPWISKSGTIIACGLLLLVHNDPEPSLVARIDLTFPFHFCFSVNTTCV